jgi:hypothetical protein
MGLLDKLKSSVPSGNEGMEKSVSTIAESVSVSLSQYLNKGKEFIQEDVKYLEYVANSIFKMLPFPIQLLGKERLKWDPIMLDVRDEVVVINPDKITLQPNSAELIVNIVKKHLLGK